MLWSRILVLFTACALLAGQPAAAARGTATLADFPLEDRPEEPAPDFAPEPLATRTDQNEASEAAIALEAWVREGDNADLYAGCYLTERNTLRILLTAEQAREDLVRALAAWEEILEFNFVTWSAAELDSQAELLRTRLESEAPGALYTMSVDLMRNLILVYVHAAQLAAVEQLTEDFAFGRELEAGAPSPLVIIPIAADELPTYKPEGRVLTAAEAVLEVVPGRDGHHMVVLRATGTEDLSYGAAFHVSRLPAGADPEDEAAWLPVPTRMPHFVIDILYLTAAGETARYDFDSGFWLLEPGERYRLMKEVRIGDDPEPCLVHAELPQPWRDPADRRWNRQALLAALAPGVHVEPEETPFFAVQPDCIESDQSRALAAWELSAGDDAVLDAYLEGERLVLLYADEAARAALEPRLADWADIIDWQFAWYRTEDLTALAETAREQFEAAGSGVLWRVDYDTGGNRVLAYVHADHLEEAITALREIKPDFAVPEAAPPPLVLVPLDRADLSWRDAPEGEDGAAIGVALEVVAETEAGLTLRLRNNSEEVITFGNDYRVERRVQTAGGERWEVVPNSSGAYAWNDLLHVLEPGVEREIHVRPGDWLCDPGQVYRVGQTIMLPAADDRKLELYLELPQLTPETWD